MKNLCLQTTRLLCALLCVFCVGNAWAGTAVSAIEAQSTDLNSILSANHGLVRLYSNRNTTEVAVNNGDKMMVARADAAGTTTSSQIWLIEAKDKGYTLRSMSTGKYVQSVRELRTAHPLGETGSTFYITTSTNAETQNAYVISSTENFADQTCLHADDVSRVVVWHAPAKESAWNIVAANDANYDELMGTFGGTPTVPPSGLSGILSANHGLVYLYSTISGRNNDYLVAEQAGEIMAGNTFSGSTAQIWQIQAAGNGYTLRNMSSGKYVYGPENKTLSLKAQGSTFYIAPSEVAGFTDNFTISSSQNFSEGTCLYYSGGLVEGGNKNVQYSTWNIVPATGVDYNALLETLAPGRPHYYKLRSKAYGHLITELWVEKKLKGSADGNLPSQYWKFTENEGKYTIQSVSSKLYVQSDPGESDYFCMGPEPAYFTLDEVKDESATYYSILHESTSDRGFHEGANQGDHIVSWLSTADASRWYLDEVELSAEQIAAFESQYHDEYEKYASDATATTFLSFFKDASATELKDTYSNMGDAQLRNAMSALPAELQDIAVKVKNGSWAAWEEHFRVAEYGAFSNAAYWAQQLKTSQYGSINNPTGIVANDGDKVFIFVGSDIPADATLKAETRCTANVPSCSNSGINPQVIPLKKGLNFLPCTNHGSQIYITYLSKNGDLIANYPPLKIHVEGGAVQGYVDIKKHTDDDWLSMRNANLFQADNGINLLGNYAQLYVSTSATRKSERILPLIGLYDWYVETELDLMGLTAVPDSLSDVPGASEAYADLYPKKVNNRLLCVGTDNKQLHGGNGHICLGYGYEAFDYETMKNRGANSWGAAHEYGHVNQGAICMIGSTEVSNNLFSDVILYKGGSCTSRGWNVQQMQEARAQGKRTWLELLGHNGFFSAQMFYSLYLYYHAAGNDPLFYQKLFKLLRESPMVSANGNRSGAEDYLHFALKACEAANEDLTDFFEYWGFFEPINNVHVSEYGKDHYLTTTQNQIAGIKSDMAKYAKKCNAAMVFIDDRAVTSYKENGQPRDAFDTEFSVDKCTTDFPGAMYTAFKCKNSRPVNMAYTVNNGVVSLAANGETAVNDRAVSGIKFYDSSNRLVYIAAQNTFAIPSSLLGSIDHSKTKLALPDGTMIPLYQTTDANVFLQTIHHGDGTTSSRYTKGNDGAELSKTRDGANAVAQLFNPNGTVPANAPSSLSDADNIAVGTSFRHLKLSDDANFVFSEANNQNYKAKNIAYSRTLQKGWNTVCLPFAFSSSELNSGCEVEVFKAIREEGGETVLVFEKTTEVPAGVPCLILNGTNADITWNFSKMQESGIAFTGQPTTNTSTDYYMNGSFSEKNIGTNHYKMNDAGNEFGKTSEEGVIYPFRAYVSPKTANANAALRIMHDGSLTDIGTAATETEGTECYDLWGRKVAEPERGQIYILGGKKVIFEK